MVELFAGVGGFRLGLEGPPGSPRNGSFKSVWSNQWEPSTKLQHAAELYTSRWHFIADPAEPNVHRNPNVSDDVFVNADIGTIPAETIPEHDLLVGGFPCQDYSVAKTLNTADGLEGKKGVLWWDIHRIAEHHRPSYLLLENVDRLLKSPVKQRGRDFAVMLASLADLGYVVEWRVIVASEYGFPQRRKRVFILAHGPDTPGHAELSGDVSPQDWIEREGVFAKALPIKPLGVISMPQFKLEWKDEWNRLARISDEFNNVNGSKHSPFENAGVMVDDMVYSARARSSYGGPSRILGDILEKPVDIPPEFVLDADSLLREKGWIYLKGAKKQERTAPSGFVYPYNEGPVTFPDRLDKPSRTIVTGEGGKSPSRFKHVVIFKPTSKLVKELELNTRQCAEVRSRLNLKDKEWLRRLLPVELERLNGFPDNHTEGVTDGKRAFLMGNALVVGVISKIGESLADVVGVCEAGNSAIKGRGANLTHHLDELEKVRLSGDIPQELIEQSHKMLIELHEQNHEILRNVCEIKEEVAPSTLIKRWAKKLNIPVRIATIVITIVLGVPLPMA